MNSGVVKAPERDRGQHHRRPRVPAGDRQEPPLHREEQHEHDADPEHGHRLAEEDDHRGRVVARACCGAPRCRCRPARATASASTTARHVSASVVGMRSMTSPNAGSRWKNDWPKSPRAALVTKRTNCVGSGSESPSASRSFDAIGLGRLRHDQGDRVAAGVEDRERDQRDADTDDDEAEEAPDQERRHGASSLRQPLSSAAWPRRARATRPAAPRTRPSSRCRACRSASTGRPTAPLRGSCRWIRA